MPSDAPNGTVEKKLAEMGVELKASSPAANYVPYTMSGNILYVSGQIPMGPDGIEGRGKLGGGMSIEDGQAAARLCAINVLAQAKAALGDLDRIVQVLKTQNFVAATPDFGDHPEVANGASDFFVEVLGDKGKHARAAVGMASLPRGVAVEVDAGDRVRVTSLPPWLTARPIAHRGLHDLAAGRPENSLAAFRAAMEHGYAIECDLQPAGDGTAMVFHDAKLERLTGEPGLVADRSASVLGALKLHGTNEAVPRLREMLDLVADRVPIVLELKGPQDDPTAFASAVGRTIAGYSGRLALMSFDHALVREFGRVAPDRPRGLTAMGGEECFAQHSAVYEEADLGFTSYEVNALPNRFVRRVRESGGAAITWTVRTPEQVRLTREHADQMTFEGFLPDG